MRSHAAQLVIAAVVVLALAGGVAYEHAQVTQLHGSVASLEVALSQLASTTSSVASSTAANIAALSKSATGTPQKTPNQQLQDAVAEVTPGVVSIVESQVVPLLRVTYENPFGNDPFFRDFGVQVPVYHQVGTTTQQVAAGTGFIVRSGGYIITNRHVVADSNATYTVLLPNGKKLIGTVIWRSPSQDLAVVKIPGSDYPTVPLGNSSDLRVGQTVFAVGNALGQYSNSVSVGIVSGLNRTITAANEAGATETLAGVIQTDAAINPGNSGGPLVGLDGKAVGVNVAVVQGSANISFAMPISQVVRALANLGI
ncbi:MAG TPA: trypsin-like peptidase domain-containing protein [Candidatus Paceibacterota bacterium]|nr:trypsin-like peptidase domain-containing protein [Candidatus Paceibacterota bacterium]